MWREGVRHLHDSLGLSRKFFGRDENKESGTGMLLLLLLLLLRIVVSLLLFFTRLDHRSERQHKCQSLPAACYSSHVHIASCQDGGNCSGLKRCYYHTLHATVESES